MEVTQFERLKWRSSEDLAEHLGCSRRTIFRRIKSGDIKSQEREEGTVYRVVNEAWYTECLRSVTRHSESSDTPSDTGDIDGDSVTREAFEALAESNALHAKILDRLGQSIADSDRLLDMIERKDAEMSELHRKLDVLRDELELSRREAITWRARYHVARGRVEMDDE
jgi:predicted nuclease with TOPRIM domain